MLFNNTCCSAKLFKKLVEKNEIICFVACFYSLRSIGLGADG